MKNYDTYLFDLDGTLTDPRIGITNAIMHALAKKGITVADRSELYCFIGPPLLESFQQHYGCSLEEAKELLKGFREYFETKGLYENAVMPGAKELLSALKAAGKKVLLATSKPEKFAALILEHFNLMTYFDGVYGATMDEQRTQKSEVIAWALGHAGEVGRAVMIGDRKHDIEGARANDLDSIGVLCGFGSRDELEQAGATGIVENLAEIFN